MKKSSIFWLCIFAIFLIDVYFDMQPKKAANFDNIYQAAQRSDMVAEYELANIYKDGNLAKQDYTEAAKWYRKSAEQGYAPAEVSLGVALGVGWGVPQDKTEADLWFKKAADQGDWFGKYHVATTNSWWNRYVRSLPQDVRNKVALTELFAIIALVLASPFIAILYIRRLLKRRRVKQRKEE